MHKYRLCKVLALAMLAAGIGAAQDDQAATTLTKVGEPAPSIDLTLLNGEKVNSEDLRGKVVLLNFFATWCGPCRQELPHLQSLFDKHKSEYFIIISVGREHSAEELTAFAAENEYTYPMAPDPDRTIYGKFATKYVPRTYLIGAGGKILYQSIGYNDSEFNELLKALETALNEAKADKNQTKNDGASDDGSRGAGPLKSIEVHGEIRTRAQYRG